ncbi:MAG: MFS transporter, partial [Desulfosporosinus sp.]
MKLNIANEKTTLFAVTVTSFLTTFMGSSITLSIPSIGTEFNSSTILLNWIVTGYILASAAFSLPMGRFSDIAGRKRIFLGGIWLFSIFSLLSGLTWSIQALIIFRIMQGLASAMIFSTNMAILVSTFPPQKRGLALGFSTSATYIG